MVINIHIVASPPVQKMLCHVLSFVSCVQITDLQSCHMVLCDSTAPYGDYGENHLVLVLGEHIMLPTTAKKLLAYIHMHYNQYQSFRPVVWGDFILYPEQHTLYKDTQSIQFTALESKVMAVLMTHDNISKANLLTSVWGMRDGVHTHTVATHMSRLRKKLHALCGDIRIDMTPDGAYVLKYNRD